MICDITLSYCTVLCLQRSVPVSTFLDVRATRMFAAWAVITVHLFRRGLLQSALPPFVNEEHV
jgi:hypothetical protein